MARYALTDETGLVVNVIEWDGESPWSPPADLTAIALPDGSTAGRNWTCQDGAWTAPIEGDV